MSVNSVEKVLLPHHEQQQLCTTRLPYRQGRKLTAVKAYTIANESNHLLVFGVPSLDLRQEAKSLFARFGKLLQFNLSAEHHSEVFTETYHAKFEKIHSARIAKRMLDTKNFYGGSLHVCYAPELESTDETRQKILKRKQDVLFRLKNLEKEVTKQENPVILQNVDACTENSSTYLLTTVAQRPKVDSSNHAENYKRTMNMGEVNTIIVSKKRKKMKPMPIVNEIDFDEDSRYKDIIKDIASCSRNNEFSADSEVNKANERLSGIDEKDKEVEIVDFTSTEREVVSNINEALNYNKFGNEVIKRLPPKPVNVIKFNINNKRT